MIQRIALLAGGLGAAAVLAVALGLTNFVFAGPAATKQTADSQPAAVQADNSVAAAPDQQIASNAGNGAAAQNQTKKVVDKVYIAPTPTPKTVRVPAATRNPPPAPPATNTPAKPSAPSAPPAWHDDGQQSEHEGGHHGHERGDD